ncbi:hypothetical protein ACP4J4_01820 [Aureimonas ureilytica]|uniref:hypothetical protein n=1 Tax=Aureimonas ureilytica TaxID=401562 RepID=UPI003CE98565
MRRMREDGWIIITARGKLWDNHIFPTIDEANDTVLKAAGSDYRICKVVASRIDRQQPGSDIVATSRHIFYPRPDGSIGLFDTFTATNKPSFAAVSSTVAEVELDETKEASR